MAAPKTKRGRLSTIDTLPDWADEAKLSAFSALKERKMPQLEILDLFNAQASSRQARTQGASLAVQLATAEYDLRWLSGQDLTTSGTP